MDPNVCLVCGKEAINASGACKKCWLIFARVYSEEI
uniref:ORF52 n=1 Tax=Nitrosopumilaceae spindle-shaped virus TaxID=3065433 RepID=A0AAT9JB31_9VIRU